MNDPPPALTPDLYSHETPNLVVRAITVPSTPPEVDVRIRRAEDHFELGKKLYQQGDAAAARTEFDRAIEVLLSAPENIPERSRLERRLDHMVESIYRYDLDASGTSESQREVVYDKSPYDDLLQMTFATDPNLTPKVKEELQATASQLPLEANDAVLSYINYFSSEKGKKVLLAGLQRSGRFRPMIQRILDEEGVPRELIYLAQIESGFLPRAQSYRAAVGMWQFVQFRGREYGLFQTPGTDDRLDPEKATRAAAHHLHDLYTQFGDWYLAMAAYNCGPNCVDRAVQRTGYADFWELRSRGALPKETMNYVPAILAATIVAKNAKDYGLDNIVFDEAVQYDTITVQCPTNVAVVADALDLTASDVQDLNPALLKPITPVGFDLHVPKGSGSAVTAALNQIPEDHRAAWRLHRVQSGESIAEIARRYATPADSIADANATVAAMPETGDLLVIPVAARVERAIIHTVAVRNLRNNASRASVRLASNRTPERRGGTKTLRTAAVTHATSRAD